MSGILSWSGFDGLEPIDRQIMLGQALRARFNRDDQLAVSILITLIPAEHAVYRESRMA